ncbi:MAG TPA: hypothetical protein VK864_14655, partial [Longimicrobiales bacterium]|nr:hypothetical protein [Longimicrobiales bacterium]
PLLRESVAHFEAAIARDSSFALAWSGLADALDALTYRSIPDQGRIPEAKNAALRAILLEPEMAEGWASLGVLVLDFDRDWKVGELALRRAIELRPGYAFAHRGLADLLGLTGRIDEAHVHARQAAQLDPLAGFTLMAQAHSLYVLGRYAEARAAFLRAVRANSIAGLVMAVHARDLGFSAEEAAHYAREWARRFDVSNLDDVALVGRAVLVPGLRTEARAAIRRLEREGKMSMRDLATASAAIGDYAHTIELLERLVELRQPPPGVAANPVFDPLREDPRFIRILDALRLPNCDAACRAAAAARAPK